MTRHQRWWLVVTAVVVLWLMQGTAMAKMVLWSAMKGRVELNGQPAAGAVLTRTYHWHWGDRTSSDQATTNAAGEFAFPAIEGRSLLASLLPHQPVIEQVMKIEYQGKIHDAWAFFKYSYEDDAENKGRPIVVTCRLEASLGVHGDVTSRCDFH